MIERASRFHRLADLPGIPGRNMPAGRKIRWTTPIGRAT